MDQKISTTIELLDGIIEDVLVLPDTPSLMSAGKLNDAGFSFYWTHGYLPCLLSTTTNKLLVMDVFGGLPMILEGGVFEKIRDIDTLSRLSGAKWIQIDGEDRISFPTKNRINRNEGMNLYQEIQSTPGLLKYSTRERCNIARSSNSFDKEENAVPAIEEGDVDKGGSFLFVR